MKTDLPALARILLHTDGSVHLCLEDKRTYYATAFILRHFFLDPIRYTQKGVHQECASTQEINPQGRTLQDIPGVTLAYLSRNKEIVCNFPELFQFVFSSTDADSQHQRITMEQYCSDTKLSDAKSFLLWFYLVFIKNLGPGIKVQQKLEISREVFFDALGEIFDSVVTIEEPVVPDLSLPDRIKSATQARLFEPESEDEDSKYITFAEYGDLHGVKYDKVLYLHSKKLLKDVKVDKKPYRVSRFEPFPSLQPRDKARSNAVSVSASPKSKPTPTNTRTTAADIEAYILSNKLFSPVIAQVIFSEEELKLYEEYGFIEVKWNGRPCLIKDFDLDYVCEDGRTNRVRMENGEAPRSRDPSDPNAEEKAVCVHHIGQLDVAFATIDDYLHYKKGLFGEMHPRKGNADDKLHDAFFELEKENLWKTYVREYDKAGSFDKIYHEFPKKQS